MNHEITTTLKMLRARGGALDLKAVEIIEAMDAVGLEMEAEHTEFRGACRELDEVSRELDDVRTILAKALNIQPVDADTPLLLAHAIANALNVAHQRLAAANARARETAGGEDGAGGIEMKQRKDRLFALDEAMVAHWSTALADMEWPSR